MFLVIGLLIIVVCILLSVVVLSQASKGDGLSGSLGGPGSMGAMMGVRRASDLLVRATITLAAAFAVLTIVANLFFLPTGGQQTANPLTSGAAPTPAMPQNPVQQSAPAVQQSAPGQQGQPPAQTPPAK